MKNKILHKFLGCIFSLVILFPFAVQALHVLNSHEHQVVCVAEDSKHFHSQELDCSIFHTPINQVSYEINQSFTLVSLQVFSDRFADEKLTIPLTSYQFKSSRAPPVFIV